MRPVKRHKSWLEIDHACAYEHRSKGANQHRSKWQSKQTCMFKEELEPGLHEAQGRKKSSFGRLTLRPV
jgi:hypothetical protein